MREASSPEWQYAPQCQRQGRRARQTAVDVEIRSKAELEAFFNSPFCAESLKEQFVRHRPAVYGETRAYVDGNGGNIAIKVGEDIALCTPTLVSKGFLKPEDMCLVDFEGNQLCGVKKRTSEISDALANHETSAQRPLPRCHCHPPYAAGFAVAGMAPPTRA